MDPNRFDSKYSSSKNDSPKNNNEHNPETELHFFHGLMGLLLSVIGVLLFVIMLGLLGQLGFNLFSLPMVALQSLVMAAILSIAAYFTISKLYLNIFKTFYIKKLSIVYFVIAVLGVIPMGIMVDQILFWLYSFNSQLFSTHSLDEFSKLFKNASAPGFILLSLAVSVCPAIGEELMFRGLIFRSFNKDMSPSLAIAYSSFLFGLIHFDVLQGTGAVILGLYLGFIVYIAKSIWPAVGAHFLNNLIACYFARFYNLSAKPTTETKDNVAQIFTIGYSLATVIISFVLIIIVISLLLNIKKNQN